MPKYANVCLTVAGTPWAMQYEKLMAMVAILRNATNGEKLTSDEISARIGVDAAKMHPNTDRAIAGRPGSIALLSLRGVMSNRAAMVTDVSTGGGTNMEQFGSAFRQAMASDQVKAIILDVDSPGGSVYGTTEMADEIFAARGTKPVIAQVNALCASAAYWVASACDEIVVTPTGQVGSVGVYSVHEDISKMLSKEGVKETIVSAGKYKTEGNPYERLGKEAREAMQETVDQYYGMFVDAIARGRGVRTSAVREGFGEGRCFVSKAAVANGMADRIGTLQDTLSRWGVKPGASSKSRASSTPRLDAARRRLELISRA